MKFNHAPKGWNSWDCYGASVTEAEVIANAEVLKSELFDLGWDTVVVDIQWYEPTANSSMYHKFADLEMDAYSRLMPAVNRFPSSEDGVGFKVLGQKIHDMGLKFGIHIMRGIPRQAVQRRLRALNIRRVILRIPIQSRLGIRICMVWTRIIQDLNCIMIQSLNYTQVGVLTILKWMILRIQKYMVVTYLRLK